MCKSICISFDSVQWFLPKLVQLLFCDPQRSGVQALIFLDMEDISDISVYVQMFFLLFTQCHVLHNLLLIIKGFLNSVHFILLNRVFASSCGLTRT